MPASDAIAELRQFTVCQLSDALGPSCFIETSIPPIDPQFRICGPALTAECAPGDNLTVHHALHLARAGEVLIVGGSPNCDAALWGELMSISAQSKGVAGTIVDGPVRDSLEIRRLGYPVFCRHFKPSRATKEAYGRINVPVRIGALSISPKDFVLADANGIASVPHARVREAIDLASEVVRNENKVRDEIFAGRTIFDIFKLENCVPTSQQQTAKTK
ncbi:MAG TPA: RraA family protein [Candidatus Sulfotelmatobacter sp.]|jgi:4-hydroxy-4-methyl-2-oxoglutarate aldolase|nr:RraA family protein [Candidatus Sulfotelmatobacter sp.]